MCRTSPNVRRSTTIIIVSVVRTAVLTTNLLLTPGGRPPPSHPTSNGCLRRLGRSMTPHTRRHLATLVVVNASTVINLVINPPPISLQPAHCPYLPATLPPHCGPSPGDNQPRTAPFNPYQRHRNYSSYLLMNNDNISSAFHPQKTTNLTVLIICVV